MQCSRHLKAQDRTCTLFVNTNEFVFFSYREETTKPNNLQADYQGIIIPSVRDKGAVSKFLKQEVKKGGSLSQPCITMPRLLFIANKISLADPTNMSTLRFRGHANRDLLSANRLAKNMIDLSSPSRYLLIHLLFCFSMISLQAWRLAQMATFGLGSRDLLKQNHMHLSCLKELENLTLRDDDVATGAVRGVH